MITKRFSKIHTSLTVVMSILCFLPQCSNSGTPEEQSSASAVVRQFCELDLNGVRLNSKSYAAILPLIAYDNEPGWDGLVVVSGYKIGKPQTGKDRIIVPVQYHVLGVMYGFQWTPAQEAQVKFKSVAESKKEFQMIKSGDTWKIAAPVMHPHVSVQATLNLLHPFFVQYANGQRSDGQENDLKVTIAALEKLDHTIKPSNHDGK